MTYTEERVAAEMGRVMLAIYRAGLEVCVRPDALNGRAEARILTKAIMARRVSRPKTTRAAGDSPLAAICAAVERYNERAGAVVVKLD
jgi:hypothetical protein